MGDIVQQINIKARDAEIYRLRAEIERLRAALRPFAEEAEGRDDERDDEPLLDIPFQGSTTVTVGDCRRARAVLKDKP